jgi:hypothetical protein
LFSQVASVAAATTFLKIDVQSFVAVIRLMTTGNTRLG